MSITTSEGEQPQHGVAGGTGSKEVWLAAKEAARQKEFSKMYADPQSRSFVFPTTFTSTTATAFT